MVIMIRSLQKNSRASDFSGQRIRDYPFDLTSERIIDLDSYATFAAVRDDPGFTPRPDPAGLSSTSSRTEFATAAIC
jgi:hypothetical protein